MRNEERSFCNIGTASKKRAKDLKEKLIKVKREGEMEAALKIW